MVNRKIHIESKKGEIRQRLADGQTLQEVNDWLHSIGILMYLKTLSTKIRLWGLETKRTQLRRALAEPSLVTSIRRLWQDKSLSDILIVLRP